MPGKMTNIEIKPTFNGRECDLVIDASEGQHCDLYEFEFNVRNQKKSVLLKSIGIGIDPMAFSHDSDVIVLANSSVWVYSSVEERFDERARMFPVVDGVETEHGFLVIDHAGCVLVSYDAYKPIWEYHRDVMEDYAVEDGVVRLSFDMGDEVTIDLKTGLVVE